MIPQYCPEYRFYIKRVTMYFMYTVWIGGSDQINENDFIWSKSGNSVNLTQWSPNEPNDYQGNEDCIEMDALHGKWNDMPCGSTYPFICEKNSN